MNVLATKIKDPDAALDYAWLWRKPDNPWLEEGDTIDSHEVFVEPAEPGGIVVDSTSATPDGRVVAWLSGGVAGADYRVTCRVETAFGRREDASIRVLCRDK